MLVKKGEKLLIDDSRLRWLTKRQREIAIMARDNGYVHLNEIKVFYSSREHWSRAIEKLRSFNIIYPKAEDGVIRFYFIPINAQKQQNTILDYAELEKQSIKALEQKLVVTAEGELDGDST